MTNDELAGMIDHTFLKAAGAADAIEKLCEEVRTYKFACAMVNPGQVARAVRLLGDAGRVGTVIDFPLGQGTPQSANRDAEEAIALGARDIDFVIDVRKLKYGSADDLRRELAARAATCHAHAGVVAKLIIECCYLTDDEKVRACLLARDAGFDFVKTSTGFGTGGATVADVALMRRTVGPAMGVKAAGGIHTRTEALALIAAGATRLGCSAGVAILNG